LPPFCVYARRVAAITAKVEKVAKSSKKALVKPFCEKKFTEFLARVEKMVSVFTSSPLKVSLQGKNFEGKFSRQKWGRAFLSFPTILKGVLSLKT